MEFMEFNESKFNMLKLINFINGVEKRNNFIDNMIQIMTVDENGVCDTCDDNKCGDNTHCGDVYKGLCGHNLHRKCIVKLIDFINGKINNCPICEKPVFHSHDDFLLKRLSFENSTEVNIPYININHE